MITLETLKGRSFGEILVIPDATNTLRILYQKDFDGLFKKEFIALEI